MAEGPDRRRPDRARDERTGGDSAAARIRNQTQWVDLQIKRAMERGEFDNLPGAGKPLGDLGSPHDRDWWLKKLIERERISVLPAALQLRKDDAELDDLLDREATEKQVRTVVEDFNRRIIEARRQLQGGPPVVTPTRDVDVGGGALAGAAPAAADDEEPRPRPRPRHRQPPRRRWWRR